MRLTACLPICPADSTADVKGSHAEGFVIHHETGIDSSPEQIYETLAGNVSSCWEKPHGYSANAANFAI